MSSLALSFGVLVALAWLATSRAYRVSDDFSFVALSAEFSFKIDVDALLADVGNLDTLLGSTSIFLLYSLFLRKTGAWVRAGRRGSPMFSAFVRRTDNEDLVHIFRNVRVLLPLKGAVNDDTVADDKFEEILASTSDECIRTQWSGGGGRKATIDSRSILDGSRNVALTSSYEALVPFANLVAPRFSFDMEGFENDYDSDCTFDDDDNLQAFSSVDKIPFHSVPNGLFYFSPQADDEGFFYWGRSKAEPYYGAYITFAWTVEGTRRDLDLEAGKYVRIPALSSFSDVSFTVTATERPRFEVYRFALLPNSAIVFSFDEHGWLERSLHAYVVDIAQNTTVVFEYPSFGTKFNPNTTAPETYNSETQTYDFEYEGIITARLMFSDSIANPSSIDIKLSNAPDGFEVITSQWTINTISDTITLRVSIADPSQIVAVTTAMPTPSPPPMPVPMCERNCNGHGRCVAGLCILRSFLALQILTQHLRRRLRLRLLRAVRSGRQ